MAKKKKKDIGKETLQGLKIPRYTTCTYLVATIAKTITYTSNASYVNRTQICVFYIPDHARKNSPDFFSM